jgi:hypothetical protein
MSSFVDSKHQKLSQDEIIAIAAKEIGGGHSAEQIKASLASECYNMKGVLIREGNTLFMVHPSPVQANIGIFRAINADTMPNYLKNCLTFTKAIGVAGFKQLITQFKEPSLLNIFSYVKRNQPFPNMGYNVKKTKDGQYQVVVNLGDTKQQGALPDQAPPQPQGAL